MACKLPRGHEHCVSRLDGLKQSNPIPQNRGSYFSGLTARAPKALKWSTSTVATVKSSNSATAARNPSPSGTVFPARRASQIKLHTVRQPPTGQIKISSLAFHQQRGVYQDSHFALSVAARLAEISLAVSASKGERERKSLAKSSALMPVLLTRCVFSQG